MTNTDVLRKRIPKKHCPRSHLFFNWFNSQYNPMKSSFTKSCMANASKWPILEVRCLRKEENPKIHVEELKVNQVNKSSDRIYTIFWNEYRMKRFIPEKDKNLKCFGRLTDDYSSTLLGYLGTYRRTQTILYMSNSYTRDQLVHNQVVKSNMDFFVQVGTPNFWIHKPMSRVDLVYQFAPR